MTSYYKEVSFCVATDEQWLFMAAFDTKQYREKLNLLLNKIDKKIIYYENQKNGN